MFAWFKKLSFYDDPTPTITTDNTSFDFKLAKQASRFRRMMELSKMCEQGIISFDDLEYGLSRILEEADE